MGKSRPFLSHEEVDAALRAMGFIPDGSTDHAVLYRHEDYPEVFRVQNLNKGLPHRGFLQNVMHQIRRTDPDYFVISQGEFVELARSPKPVWKRPEPETDQEHEML